MLVLNDRLGITRGEDKQIIFKIRENNTKDPVDLTNITTITAEFTQANRGKLVLDSSLRPAKKASAEIQAVKIIADNAGGIGNSVILEFNGVDDLDTVITEWNNANPANTVSHNGIGTELFDGSTRLEGGFEAYKAVDIEGEPLLGKVKVNMTEYDTVLLRRGNNQSVNIIIDWGYPPAGTRRIAKFDNKLDVSESR